MSGKMGLEEILQRGVDTGAFPGACYAVVTPTKITTGCVGYRELYPEKKNITLDTIYDMASLTKVIATTTAIMQLLEQGKIRLYQNVSFYLPRFRFDNINLWHLMTHTSGLPEGVSGRKDTMTKEDVWDAIYNKTELQFTPGAHIKYSDINYILLGQIVEEVSGLTLDKYTKKYIFEPLEMKDTGYLPDDTNRCAATEYRDDLTFKGYVKGFVHDETAYALNKVAGHAGLFSTVEDMSHFITMILNNGTYHNKQILSKASIDLLYRVQVKEKSGVECMPLARCLGWQTLDPASSAGELVSPNTILHTGFTGTNVFIDRTGAIGFVMLSNRVHPTRKNLLHLNIRACAANYLISHQEEFK